MAGNANVRLRGVLTERGGLVPYPQVQTLEQGPKFTLWWPVHDSGRYANELLREAT